MRFVYIVDDDRLSRAFIQKSLGPSQSALVRSFDSGESFLAEADEIDPGVVLLDLHMPGIDGNGVLKKLGERADGKFRSILVTGAASVEHAVRALKSGAVDVLEKPFTEGDLQAAVDSAFAGLEEFLAASSDRNNALVKINALTRRERAVLGMLVEGNSNKRIALALGISPRTVEIYRGSMKLKLGVNDLASVIRLAVAAGIPLVNAHEIQAKPASEFGGDRTVVEGREQRSCD